MPLLELDDVGVRLGATTALDGVSLIVPRGVALGIAGGAGAGKTLLALRIAGLLPRGATATGTIRFDGSDMPRSEQALVRLRGQRIGFVFGDGRAGLDPSRTIGAQMARATTLGKAGTISSPAELLGPFGLADAAATFPHELDGDARRLALLALALARRPDLVVADEPAFGLDPVAARRVLDLLSQMRTTLGFALLLLARDYRAVALLCEQAIVLDRGRIVETGPSDVLFARPQHEHSRQLVAASRLRMRTIARAPIGADLLRVESLRLVGDRGSPGTLSFAVRRGETLAILGRAGAGKSRLGRVVAGLATARAGTLVLEHDRYRGADLPKHRRREIGLVFADAAASFDAELPIGAALAEPLRLEPQLLHEEQGRRLLEVVRAVGLEPADLTRRPAAFDSATLARFAVARALIARPTLVVLDDPGAGLDLVQRNGLLELLARLRSDHNLTYLVLTRDIEVARDLADRVLVMDDGAIVEQGKPYDLLDAPQHALTQALVAARLPDVWNVTPSGAVMG